MENVWCSVSDAVQLSRDADNSDISDGLRSEIGHNPETNLSMRPAMILKPDMSLNPAMSLK